MPVKDPVAATRGPGESSAGFASPWKRGLPFHSAFKPSQHQGAESPFRANMFLTPVNLSLSNKEPASGPLLTVLSTQK